MRRVALFFAAVLLGAQTASEPPVFRSTTRLVQVSVVANDKSGAPIGDLRKEDFSITEEGQPQKIAFFTIQSANQFSTASEKLAPNMFSNGREQSNGVPNSVSVILLDLLNTSFSDLHFARAAILKYLQQIRPGDRVALYTLGRGLQVLHDYSTDASSLVETVRKYRGQVMTEVRSSEVDPRVAQDLKDLELDQLLKMEQRAANFVAGNRVVNTLKSLEAIANHLAGLPGRKNLVWVSGGFPLSIGYEEIPKPGEIPDTWTFANQADTAIRALNNAGVSVYPVDARGLIGMPTFEAGQDGRSAPTGTFRSVFPHRETMIHLAERTGGRASYNTNDIESSIRRAIDDSQLTYNLAYYSTHDRQDGRFRDIKVKVNREGVEVRHRRGYFAMRPADEGDKFRQEQMRTALWSPLDATAIRVNARVDRIDKPEPNTIHTYVQVDPASISLQQEGDRWKGKIDLWMAQKDETGKILGTGVTDTVTLALTEKTYRDVLRRGLLYRYHFTGDQAARTLRIIVRDVHTAAVGTLTVPLASVPFTSVPDSVLQQD